MDPTSASFWQIWLPEWKASLSLERGLAANTLESYLRDAYQCADWQHNHDLAPEALLEYLTHLALEGYAPASQARALAALRNLSGFLVDQGVWTQDPLAQTAAPKLGFRLPHALSPQQVQLLGEQIDPNSPLGARDTALLELLYAGGLRVSEAIDVRVHQLHDREGWLSVVGKGNKERVVPLSDLSLGTLESYRLHSRPHLGPKTDHLIVNARGGSLTRMGAWKIVQKWGQSAGIAVSPHSLRHSYASHLLQGGMDLCLIQELLGHASLLTTQVYTHLDRKHLWEIHAMYHPRGSGALPLSPK